MFERNYEKIPGYSGEEGVKENSWRGSQKLQMAKDWSIEQADAETVPQKRVEEEAMQDPMQIRKRLGQLIRRLREQRGWSQEELANATGFGRSFTSAIERGTKDIRISTLVKLANIFDLQLRQLFQGEGEGRGPRKILPS